ncbi:MAG: DUF1730 domain-containing protein [Oscillospiraceae bacterium]
MNNLSTECKIGGFSAVSFQLVNTFNTRSAARIPSGAKSVLMIIFPYYNKSAFCGNISAYCAVKDYHVVVMEQLKSIILELEKKYPEEIFVPFVDASPIDEVDGAVKAGLGVRGKNSLLITPQYGSFVFIGEIVTTLEMGGQAQEERGCMGCKACQKSCPGSCITEKGIDKERCASFISQKKQELTQEQIEILKRAKTVFGCDICQKVCPHNKGIEETENLFSEDIVNCVTQEMLKEGCKSRAFGFRGEKVLQRNLQLYHGEKSEL